MALISPVHLLRRGADEADRLRQLLARRDPVVLGDNRRRFGLHPVDQRTDGAGRGFEFGGEAHDVDQRRAQVMADDIGEALDLLVCAGQVGGTVRDLILQAFGEALHRVAGGG